MKFFWSLKYIYLLPYSYTYFTHDYITLRRILSDSVSKFCDEGEFCTSYEEGDLSVLYDEWRRRGLICSVRRVTTKGTYLFCTTSDDEGDFCSVRRVTTSSSHNHKVILRSHNFLLQLGVLAKNLNAPLFGVDDSLEQHWLYKVVVVVQRSPSVLASPDPSFVDPCQCSRANVLKIVHEPLEVVCEDVAFFTKMPWPMKE